MGFVAAVYDGEDTHPVTSSLYATCSTAAATAAKEITLANIDELVPGMMVMVKFSHSNTASNPTLTINSLGPYPVYTDNTNKPKGSYASWVAESVVPMLYLGGESPSWMVVGSNRANMQQLKSDSDTALATAETTLVALNYNTGTSYSSGDYCLRNGTLYQCTGATSGTWDSSKWSSAKIASRLKTLATSISTETTNRTNADNGLSGRIDALTTTVNAINSYTQYTTSGINGKAIRFDSGIQIAYVGASFNGKINNVTGSLYSSAEISLPQWPKSFISVPYVVAGIGPTGSGDTNVPFFVSAVMNATASSAGKVRVFHTDNGYASTNAKMWITVIGIGTWK